MKEIIVTTLALALGVAQVGVAAPSAFAVPRALIFFGPAVPAPVWLSTEEDAIALFSAFTLYDPHAGEFDHRRPVEIRYLSGNEWADLGKRADMVSELEDGRLRPNAWFYPATSKWPPVFMTSARVQRISERGVELLHRLGLPVLDRASPR